MSREADTINKELNLSVRPRTLDIAIKKIFENIKPFTTSKPHSCTSLPRSLGRGGVAFYLAGLGTEYTLTP